MSKEISKGSSDVDRPQFPKQQGVAKQDFSKANGGKAPGSQSKSAGIGDSIKKTRPELNFDMPGGGPVRAQFAAGRVNAEKAAASLKRQRQGRPREN